MRIYSDEKYETDDAQWFQTTSLTFKEFVQSLEKEIAL